MIDPAGVVSHNLADADLASCLLGQVRTLNASIVSACLDHVFLERLLPVTHLMIFGAGDDARPLTCWRITSAGESPFTTAGHTTRSRENFPPPMR